MPEKALRKALIGAAAALAAAVCALPAARAEEPAAPAASAAEYVNYFGTIASIDAKSGELVLVGNREDREGENVIVKLQADPNKVDVIDVKQQSVDFADLVKGDNVHIECLVEGDALIVDFITVYSQKE